MTSVPARAMNCTRAGGQPTQDSRSTGCGSRMEELQVLSGPVAILWDIENCPVPGDVSAEEVAGNVRMALRVHPAFPAKGVVTVFSVYGDFNCFPRHLRRGCQRTGVNLIDIPNGRKDVSEKAIIADMFLFALDNPPPCTLFLVSGGTEFASALHKLGQRGYAVALAVPSEAGISPALLSAGRFVWDWTSLARGEGLIPAKSFLARHVSSDLSEEDIRQRLCNGAPRQCSFPEKISERRIWEKGADCIHSQQVAPLKNADQVQEGDVVQRVELSPSAGNWEKGVNCTHSQQVAPLDSDNQAQEKEGEVHRVDLLPSACKYPCPIYRLPEKTPEWGWTKEADCSHSQQVALPRNVDQAEGAVMQRMELLPSTGNHPCPLYELPEKTPGGRRQAKEVDCTHSQQTTLLESANRAKEEEELVQRVELFPSVGWAPFHNCLCPMYELPEINLGGRRHAEGYGRIHSQRVVLPEITKQAQEEDLVQRVELFLSTGGAHPHPKYELLEITPGGRRGEKGADCTHSQQADKAQEEEGLVQRLELFKRQLQELLVSHACRIQFASFLQLYQQKYGYPLDVGLFGVRDLESLVVKVGDIAIVVEEESRAKFLVAHDNNSSPLWLPGYQNHAQY